MSLKLFYKFKDVEIETRVSKFAQAILLNKGGSLNLTKLIGRHTEAIATRLSQVYRHNEAASIIPEQLGNSNEATSRKCPHFTLFVPQSHGLVHPAFQRA
jgi:hypothetical protein